jgi:AcrR family transcriptional regulator
MPTYRHVRDKDDLLDRVVEQVVADALREFHGHGGSASCAPGGRRWPIKLGASRPPATSTRRLPSSSTSGFPQRLTGPLRHLIAEAMDQPPGALLAAEDVRYAHREGDDSTAPGHPRLATLNPNAEGEVAARARALGDKLNAEEPPMCEAGRRRPGVLLDPLPTTALVAAKATHDSHITRVRPQTIEGVRIAGEQAFNAATVLCSIARKSSVDEASSCAPERFMDSSISGVDH